MNLDKLQQKLLHAARLHTPSDAVPYAFEKRIMARLSDAKLDDTRGSWIRGLWGAAACSAAIAMLAGVLTLVPLGGKNKSGDLEQEFETTVMAMVDEASESW